MRPVCKLALATLALAGCVLAAALVWRREDAHLAGNARYAWQEGQIYRYHLTYSMSGSTTAMSILSSGSAQPEQALQSAFEGLVEETLVGKDARGYQLLVSMRPTLGPSTRFLLSISALGAVQALTFAPEVPASQRQQTRAVWSLLQAQLPSQNKPAWVTREDDLNGSWISRYTRVATDHAVFTFVKTLESGTHGPLRVLRHGDLSVKFGFLTARKEAMTGTVTTDYQLDGHAAGRETSYVSWRFLEVIPSDAASRAQSADMAVALQRCGMRSTLGGAEEQALERRRQLQERTAGTHPAALVQELVSNPEGTNKEHLRPSRQLEAFLELDPARAAQAALDGLLRADSKSAAFSSIATALTAGGGATAQEALVAAMKTLGDDAAVRRLIPHLGMVARPTTASEAFLRELARASQDAGVAAAAKLSLGIMANHLLVEQPARADSIFADAREALWRGDDPEFSLRVLGNIGHPEQTLLVRSTLATGAAAERVAALQSLRWVMTVDARQVLMDAATSDLDTQARASAVESLGYRQQDDVVLQLYVARLKSEVAVPVLKEVLRNMSTMLRTWPAARSEYAAFMEACAHPELCDYARGLWMAAG